ncbi:hypothetical protein ACQE3D_00150 [Methylomonas sp. MS20]|uniref:hypothetical protein n=1 Tax=unclassified Methylomonas TaxID=2608980 RepID=UPI0028A57BD6|nr:hypothetical protein [Methylomonas sp. MV1]MDT4332725.1 hypothetical protein [Methylomonas sp. MV1]
MKNFIYIIFIVISFSAFSFEIKPQGPESKNWISSISYNEKPCEECDGTFYKAFSAKPLHEMITSTAVISLCNTEYGNIKYKLEEGVFHGKCNAYKVNKSSFFHELSTNDAFISGTEFNDDPTELLMRHQPLWLPLPYIQDKLKAQDFEEILKVDGTLTYQSHKGGLQFLHSMKSTSEEKPSKTIYKSIDYIKNNFNLAKKIEQWKKQKNFCKLQEFPDELVPTNNYYRIFLGHKRQCDYSDYKKLKKFESRENVYFKFERIFSQCGNFSSYGEYSAEQYNELSKEEKPFARSKAIALLSLGSALHVIQDSYSSSHVRRSADWKIEEFYNYNDNKDNVSEAYPQHCEHDQASLNNKRQIEKAVAMTYMFLRLFITSDCNPSDDAAQNTCSPLVDKWLRDYVFLM